MNRLSSRDAALCLDPAPKLMGAVSPFGIFATVYIAGSMGWAAVVLLPNPGGEESGTAFRIFWAVMYCLTAFFAVQRWPRFRQRHIPLTLLSIYVPISAVWSYTPANTIIYGGVVAINVFFCFMLAHRWNLLTFQKVTLNIILLSSALGLLLFIIGWNGVVYFDAHDRYTLIGTTPLRFFFYHKITAGLYCVVAMIFNECLNTGPKKQFIRLFLLLCVILSGSASAIAAIPIYYIYFKITSWCCENRVSSGAFISGLLCSILPLATLSYFFLPDLLSLLDRDPTLTGRTLLWSWGLEVGLERPLFGWGYDGYISSELAAQHARAIAQFQNYEVPHFHNSYIQMFVDLGFIGLLLVLLAPVLAFKRFYEHALSTRAKDDTRMVALVLFLLTASIYIHLMYKHNDFSALLTFTLFLLSPKLGVSDASPPRVKV